MNTLGFHNEELFEMITTIVTDYRDRKYDHVQNVLSDPETIHLFSTELMEHMVLEIPSFFLDPPSANTVTATPDTLVKDVIGSAQERLKNVAEHLKLTFFQKNQLPFTIIRILEMVYHPLGFFQKHEFPKFVTSIEKCSYVTITYQQLNGKNISSATSSSANTTTTTTTATTASAAPTTHNGKSIKSSTSVGKEHVDLDGVLNKTQSILGKKRKRDAVEEESLTLETTQASPKRSTTPSLMKIPWITAAQVQESGPFLKELESIMAVNFGYDEEEEEEEDEEEDDEEDSDDELDDGHHAGMGETAGKDGQVRSYYVNGNNADRTSGEGTLEKKLRKDIKSMGDSIYDEYEEVDEDWTPVEDGDEDEEDEDELEEDEEDGDIHDV